MLEGINKKHGTVFHGVLPPMRHHVRRYSPVKPARGRSKKMRKEHKVWFSDKKSPYCRPDANNWNSTLDEKSQHYRA